MSFESSSLLAPPPAILPLLFEAGRILDRHADVAEALAPLLRCAEAEAWEGFRLTEGAAALVASPESRASSPLLVRVASSLASGRPGTRVAMGQGIFGKVLEAGRSLEGSDELGLWVSVPVNLHDSVAGILGFRPVAAPQASGASACAGARILLEALAALIGEALVLRSLVAVRSGGIDGRDEEAARGPAAQGQSPEVARGQAAEGRQAAEGQSPESGGQSPSGLYGRSAAMVEVRHLIETVGPTESTVLVTGESGTGKELAARALHVASPRATGPFVAVNCAALPESLIESELFGHERGSFTGAEARRKGRFELAAGGTLFFDEIGELGPTVQAKLLRVLQERTFERVGGGESLRADVRLIAATNRDLEKEVAAGRFREDLYWRLYVFPIRMPPLRERGGDVVLLADRFAETLGQRLGKPVLRISTPALDLLTSYHWPGNVRELENAIERAVVLSTDGVIHAWHLPPSLQSAASTGTGPLSTLDASLARIEKELIVEALKMNAGRASGAAHQLGITERRMGLAIHKYGIDWRRFRTKK